MRRYTLFLVLCASWNRQHSLRTIVAVRAADEADTVAALIAQARILARESRVDEAETALTAAQRAAESDRTSKRAARSMRGCISKLQELCSCALAVEGCRAGGGGGAAAGQLGDVPALGRCSCRAALPRVAAAACALGRLLVLGQGVASARTANGGGGGVRGGGGAQHCEHGFKARGCGVVGRGRLVRRREARAARGGEGGAAR
eukprot:6173400-Pleurochrysis_carterae.AAC.1